CPELVPPREPSRQKQAVAPTTSAWSSSLIHDVYRRLCGPALAEKISQPTIRQQSAALRGFRPLYVRFGSSLAIGVMFAARPLAPDVTPHVLRHSFASLAADLGYSEPVIAALIGHMGRTVTSRYVHGADAVLLA